MRVVTGRIPVTIHVSALAVIHEILTEEAKGNADVEYLHTADALDRLRPLLESIVGERRVQREPAQLPQPKFCSRTL